MLIAKRHVQQNYHEWTPLPLFLKQKNSFKHNKLHSNEDVREKPIAKLYIFD